MGFLFFKLPDWANSFTPNPASNRPVWLVTEMFSLMSPYKSFTNLKYLISVCGRNNVAATDEIALDTDPEFIVGGVNAAKGEVGWQVGLTSSANSNRASVYCGGTLIQAQWVMTAAHCTEG